MFTDYDNRANVDFYRWEKVPVHGTRRGEGLVWALTYKGKGLHALIWNRGGSWRARVYDYPFLGFREYNAATNITRVPKGMEDLMTFGTGHLLQILVWILDTLKLPTRFLGLPMHPTGGIYMIQPIPFDRAYNEGLGVTFGKLRDLLPSHLVKPFCDALRSQRYREERQSALRWEQRYPEEAQILGEVLEAKKKEINDSCIDSERVARVGDRAGMRAFRKSRSCCGSCEWTVSVWVPSLAGTSQYTLGFNYGH